MKPERVIQIMGVLTGIFVFGSTFAYSNFIEYGDYIDVGMVIYIVLMTVWGLVMLKRSKTA